MINYAVSPAAARITPETSRWYFVSRETCLRVAMYKRLGEEGDEEDGEKGGGEPERKSACAYKKLQARRDRDFNFSLAGAIFIRIYHRARARVAIN